MKHFDKYSFIISNINLIKQKQIKKAQTKYNEYDWKRRDHRRMNLTCLK